MGPLIWESQVDSLILPPYESSHTLVFCSGLPHPHLTNMTNKQTAWPSSTHDTWCNTDVTIIILLCRSNSLSCRLLWPQFFWCNLAVITRTVVLSPSVSMKNKTTIVCVEEIWRGQWTLVWASWLNMTLPWNSSKGYYVHYYSCCGCRNESVRKLQRVMSHYIHKNNVKYIIYIIFFITN